MSGRGSVVEWVETTEEVIASEECPSEDTGDPSAILTTIQHVEAPIQKLLDSMVQGEDPETEDGFYCPECQALFQDGGDLKGLDGPSFILDSPTDMGVAQRDLLTLPHGLMIGRSSIPNAGLGVINQGPAVCPGMHFGPYDGEMTSREKAMQSSFSWEIYKGGDEYEYIDATRETHSNWMRYVKCARIEEEKNLLAVQYKGSILFHCCRSIQAGDELLVWPSAKLLSHFSEAWAQFWFLKCSPTESSTTVASQIFLCVHCQLSFTTEAYLQRHMDQLHLEPAEVCTDPGGEAVETMETIDAPPTVDEESSLASLLVLAFNPVESKTCPECGKIFKHMHHLTRHKLSVHSNKRPYCCPQCRRCFSQASGLLRHQLVHQKQTPMTTVEEELAALASHADTPSDAVEECVSELTEAEHPPSEAETPQEDANEHLTVSPKKADLDSDSPQEPPDGSPKCSVCGKTFTNESYLKKHQLSVHNNVRPYVCTLCRKSFSQYSDLTRHLKVHQRNEVAKSQAVEEAPTETLPSFCCIHCSLTFMSEDNLQHHLSQQHMEQTSVVPPSEDQEMSPLPATVKEDPDPDFIAPPSVARTAQSIQRPLSQRPQRLGARSKISAITKLIAPKPRLKAGKGLSRDPASTEDSCSKPEGPEANASSQKGASKEPAEFACSCCQEKYLRKADLKAHKCPQGVKHSCAKCGETFKSPSFLRRHERTAHTNASTHICDRCNKTFSKLGNLRQHQKSNRCLKHHCSSELFACPYCQFSFTMNSYLLKHIKRHHPVEYVSYSESAQEKGEVAEGEGDGSRVCPHCLKTYASEKHFKAHTCFKKVRILYLCTDCGKGFANHYGLKQHQRIHTGEKPYSCPHCSKSFSYIGQVNVHIRTHTGEKPYLCTHCGESFRQSGDLKRHERKHTGVRPYNCPECLKSFSRPQSLKAHQMLHLGQRNFKCTQCGKSFSRNYHLRRHHQKMHS